MLLAANKVYRIPFIVAIASSFVNICLSHKTDHACNQSGVANDARQAIAPPATMEKRE
jgi:hypothetical protein